MECVNCGSNVNKDMIYCTQCGVSIESKKNEMNMSYIIYLSLIALSAILLQTDFYIIANVIILLLILFAPLLFIKHKISYKIAKIKKNKDLSFIDNLYQHIMRLELKDRRMEFSTDNLNRYISQGDINKVSLLIKAGINIDNVDRFGNSPLAICNLSSGENIKEIKQMLIDSGANVLVKEVSGEIAFISRVKDNDYKEVEIYINSIKSNSDSIFEIDSIKSSIDNESALYHAVSRSNKKLINLLLQSGADPNQLSNDGNPLLLVAINSNQSEIVDILCEHGANVNIKDKQGNPIVFTAIKNTQLEIVTTLCKHGVDVNSTDIDSNPLLLVAINSNQSEIVDILCEHGANVNINNDKGNPILLTAIENNDFDIVNTLCKYGVNCNSTDIYDNPLLWIAIKNNQFEIVSVLCENGADVNSQIPNGELIIFEAIKIGNENIIKLIASNGLDMKSKTTSGEGLVSVLIHSNLHKSLTNMLAKNLDPNELISIQASSQKERAIFAAIESQNIDIIKALINYKADICSNGFFGKTPIMFALLHPSEEIIEILVNNLTYKDTRVSYLYNQHNPCSSIKTQSFNPSTIITELLHSDFPKWLPLMREVAKDSNLLTEEKNENSVALYFDRIHYFAKKIGERITTEVLTVKNVDYYLDDFSEYVKNNYKERNLEKNKWSNVCDVLVDETIPCDNRECGYNAPKGYVSCNTCKGDKKISCSHCAGRGEIKCPECHGTRKIKIKCVKCKDGYIKCSKCNNGKNICSICKGKGNIKNNIIKKTIDCFCLKANHIRINCDQCNGSGVYNGNLCPKCKGHKTICPLCKNTFKIEVTNANTPCSCLVNSSSPTLKPCYNCNGTGLDKNGKVCTSCAGRGKICQTCKNKYILKKEISQTVKCTTCAGTGSVKCTVPECNNGKIKCTSCDDGYIDSACTNCMDGKIICSECTQGYNYCNECQGKGYTTCSRCGGKSTLNKIEEYTYNFESIPDSSINRTIYCKDSEIKKICSQDKFLKKLSSFSITKYRFETNNNLESYIKSRIEDSELNIIISEFLNNIEASNDTLNIERLDVVPIKISIIKIRTKGEDKSVLFVNNMYFSLID